MSFLIHLSDAFIFALSATLAVVFTRYVFLTFRTEWGTPWLNAGIGLAIYFTGHAIARGWVWWVYGMSAHPEHQERVDHFVGMLIGTTVMAIGALCLSRVFLTATWGPWTWQVVGIVAAALSFVLVMI